MRFSTNPGNLFYFSSFLACFLQISILLANCQKRETLSWNVRWQEIIKVREVISHTRPIPIVIPLRLFLDDINFPADNVTARVTWKFRGGEKVQQILYDATLRFQN